MSFIALPRRTPPPTIEIRLTYTPGEGQAPVYPHDMILEINAEAIRDIAAAVNAARKRDSSIEVLRDVERKVLTAIREKSPSLELGDQEAAALRNILMQRAYDQRNTTEGTDYADLAERIARDLDSEEPPMIVTESNE